VRRISYRCWAQPSPNIRDAKKAAQTEGGQSREAESQLDWLSSDRRRETPGTKAKWRNAFAVRHGEGAADNFACLGYSTHRSGP
jgi:hypothetical protein